MSKKRTIIQSEADVAQQNFDIENNIKTTLPEEDEIIYSYDEAEQQERLDSKPWASE